MDARQSLNEQREAAYARHSFGGWRTGVIGLTVAGVALGFLSLLPSHPALVWNHTASAPLGLYRIDRNAPATGDLVAVKPSLELAASLADYGVLAQGRLLLKPVAAAVGDRVCRYGWTISINGEAVAVARDSAGDGQLLPRWSGCRELALGDIFVLSPHPGSFDSRYFGHVELADVVGIARPVVTFAPQKGGDL